MKIHFTLFAWLIMATTFAQSVKVMTYNIRLDTPVDSVNQWPKRAHKVYDLIKKYDPDVLGVQEAIHHQLMGIVENVPAYGYVGVGRDDGKTKGEYSALLYKKDKFEVIDHNTFWLSETPDVAGSKSWDAAITRVASWAILKDKKTKKEFLVINTHFDHIGKEARKNSAALLKKKAAALRKNLPVILTGDFNCTREEPPFAVMADPTDISLLDTAPKEAPGTFCGFKVGAMKCNPIDYIFYTKPWTPSGYKAIDDNDGKYYPSDHLPVVVTLTLK
ncbi:endonuclease/exonuclease/phosphatase family protein [Chryseolinea lacunae]|uniref:Endonuclease/exonuclease/phosphatase family protein n=1 Tax=Chryseolinea lacunae TaxID=2801331 RepID=A0ABS1KVF7_9BACT|nr:endonuclease/exonuclease/phosphatase family protein [Chryseolinea lacunae]MBL0743394.1 endonuclease/exonuclease/phosphatase family protein [Chryseolinea lacunae]